ncbi:MAG: glycerate kinase [Clostridia bacterium]|nr:glycerate kinase [Clostridia bacterium]
MKKVVIAPDSFKGSLSSFDVCRIISEELEKRYGDIECISVPVADGGEGTVDTYLYNMGGEKVEVRVQNPIGEEITAYYALIDGHTAVIEMAQASGITLVNPLEPMKSDTYGTGQMILSAMDRGVRNIVIGIGGSATTDGGTGCIRALGVRFLGSDGNEVIRGGEGLADIEIIDVSEIDKRIGECRFTVLCDVNNPLFGEKGAAYVFAPQKGADTECVEQLDRGLRHYSEKVKEALGKGDARAEGAGAAGGLGYALMTFLNAGMKKGIDNILDMCGFEEKLTGADLVITGEGKMDEQSLRGKVPFSVAGRASGVRIIAVVGVSETDKETAKSNGIDEIIETNPLHLPFEEILPRCEEMLREAVNKINL